MKQLLKKHHKIGTIIILMAVLFFVISFFVPSLSSYLIVAGIATLVVGVFIFEPSWLPF